MIIKAIHGGIFDSISYLVCEGSKAVLIDLGVNTQKLLSTAAELKVNIEKIIMTHGHIDHIVELDNIVEKTKAKPYIHIDDEAYLTDPKLNVSAFMFTPKIVNTPCEVLRDGSVVKLEELELKIMHTPGHSPGSICVMVNNCVFSGDTLFNMGYGTVELPNGSFEEIYNSITRKLFILPEDTIVYPGHGESTTIGREKKHNPIRMSVEW